MTATWSSAAGWLGAALVLTAYILISARKVSGNSYLFQGLNFVGSAGLATSAAVAGALPSAAVNLVWMAIGIVVLLRRPAATRSPGHRG